MEIVDLEPGDGRLSRDMLPVLQELRPNLTDDLLGEVYAAGYREGLRFSAAYDDGRCVGAAGWRVVHTTNAIRKLYVDDLVTTEQARSAGIGRGLLAYLEARASELGCHVVDLDSGVQRSAAHRFYHREGLVISSFHFAKLLS